MNTPETAAFEDEFTREFMKSTKEVEDGYYLFESKTGGYTMWFPVNATLDEGLYYRQEKYRENVGFSEKYKENNFTYNLLIRYENRKAIEHVEADLSVLSSFISYEGDYDSFEHNGKNYYYAKNEHRVNDVYTVYRFFSYVESGDSDQSIKLIFETACTNPEKSCDINLEQQEEHALRLMKSIEFND
ncbi:hypothetical protein SAMN05421736_12421 [Evansella caseinilytica]|uniref:Uncharacterized protein n=1 Tax=Evansella caseinilytica TaxID=1503961 RepID=A0A1H3UR59_9BACI|nr:hypothetical protein [Evansella caseinilytica]SDZ64249.1 hypothetical protein SAMN05421736_12421 [Evansella caseinilytica]